MIKKTETGYKVRFVDLAMCEAEGRDLEDALENARYEGVNWVLSEQEETMDLPMQTHLEDIKLGEGETARMIALIMPREGWDE